MKLPFNLIMKLVDLGFSVAISISDLLAARKSKKKRFEELVEKQQVDRGAPTVVLRRPPPTNRQD